MLHSCVASFDVWSVDCLMLRYRVLFMVMMHWLALQNDALYVLYIEVVLSTCPSGLVW